MLCLTRLITPNQVTSVNGNTGAVVLSADDLAADHTVATHYTAANANIDGHLSGGVDTKLGTVGTAATLDDVTTNGSTSHQ